MLVHSNANDQKGGDIMSEREHPEVEPQGSPSFIRPLREKLTAAWRWITFQEASVDVQPKKEGKPQPKVETQRREVPNAPRYEAPHYSPKPRYESSRRPVERPSTSSRRDSERRRPTDDTDYGSDMVHTAWWLQNMSESGNRSNDCSPSQSHQNDSGSHRGGYDGGHNNSNDHSGHSSGGGYDSSSTSSSVDSGGGFGGC